jgi:cytochrome c2
MRVETAAVAILTAMLLAGCGTEQRAAASITGGNRARGAQAIGRYGCGSCHTIQGIKGARGQVGPPLTGIVRRMYVGGVLSNTPENIVRWIQDPKAVDEKTLMPKLGVTQSEATDIAAYLYTQ